MFDENNTVEMLAVELAFEKNGTVEFYLEKSLKVLLLLWLWKRLVLIRIPNMPMHVCSLSALRSTPVSLCEAFLTPLAKGTQLFLPCSLALLSRC